MKRLISLLVSSLFLFMMRQVDNTYTYSIIETPAKSVEHPLSTARPYQHLRFCGDDVVLVEHDVLEATILWLFLPKSMEQGTVVAINQAPYRVKIVQNGQTYWTISGQVTILQHTISTDGQHLVHGTIEGTALDTYHNDTLQVARVFEISY